MSTDFSEITAMLISLLPVIIFVMVFKLIIAIFSDLKF